jgi:hypothetical protein
MVPAASIAGAGDRATGITSKHRSSTGLRVVLSNNENFRISQPSSGGLAGDDTNLTYNTAPAVPVPVPPEVAYETRATSPPGRARDGSARHLAYDRLRNCHSARRGSCLIRKHRRPHPRSPKHRPRSPRQLAPARLDRVSPAPTPVFDISPERQCVRDAEPRGAIQRPLFTIEDLGTGTAPRTSARCRSRDEVAGPSLAPGQLPAPTSVATTSADQGR